MARRRLLPRDGSLAMRLAKLVVSLVLVAAVIWKVGPHAVVPAVFRWQWLLVAISVFLVSNLLGAWQWSLLLRSAGISLERGKVVQTYFVGLFFNNFLIGNVGGDIMRAFDVRRHGTSSHQGHAAVGVATIVMDRFLGFLTMMCFAGLALWAWHGDARAMQIIVGLLGAFLVAGVLLTSRRIGTRWDRAVTALLPRRMAQTVLNLRAGFVAMRQQPGALIGAACVSAFVQGMRIVVHYLCASAIGLGIPFVYFAEFIPPISVAAAFPISVGGLGMREWAAVGLFRAVGVAGAGVVTMELLAHAVTLVSSLPGALAFVVRGAKAPVAEMEKT